jgi:hypothetical protein
VRFISSLDQHPEVRKERFPKQLWPLGFSSQDLDEGWIFLEFTQAAKLHLETAPTKAAPPMPDLKCMVNRKLTFFELGEILESDLAEGVAYSVKLARKKAEAITKSGRATGNTIKTDGDRLFSAHGSLARMLRKKLTTDYENRELPCHLLLFYDQQRPWGPFDYLLQSQPELTTLIAGSKFQRVWIFDLPSATVIGFLGARDGALHAIFDWQFHVDISAPFQALVPSGDDRPDEIKQFVPVVTSSRVGNRGSKPLKRAGVIIG